MDRGQIRKILDELELMYPDAECALNYNSPFELLIAVALSAQTTDKSVNGVTPALFEKYPGPFELASASQSDVEDLIRRIGMYRTKSKNIIALSRKLVEEFDGCVPCDYDALVSLPGVGRKTANVVLSVGFGVPRIAVDTHVFRTTNRIGIVHEDNVLKTEIALMEAIPEERWSRAHHSFIFHGRQCCTARNPRCETCNINDICEHYTGGQHV